MRTSKDIYLELVGAVCVRASLRIRGATVGEQVLADVEVVRLSAEFAAAKVQEVNEQADRPSWLR